MIDTWLLSAGIMGLLALGVILRAVRTPSPDDRSVATVVAVALASMAALTLSIAWNALVITDVFIFLGICCLGIAIWQAKARGAGAA